MTDPTSDHSFSEPVHILDRFLPLPWLSFIAWVSNFLNIADVSKIPGQMPDRGAVFTLGKNGDEVFQTPIYLSHIQPDLAEKETFMQKPFSPLNLGEVDYSYDPSTYGAFNQSPEVQVRSEPPRNGSANREKVPINEASAKGANISSAVENAHELATLSSELKFVTHQLADVKAELRVAKEEIRNFHQMEQRIYDWKSQFEQQQKQAEIKRSQLRHAQDQLLERRLQSAMAELIAIALRNAIERQGLARRSATPPEPARQPSTYSVPKRKNTGIYRPN